MYAPQKIISDNLKTDKSINFPLKGHCRPTKVCIKCCYARSGSMTLPNTTKKQIFVSKYFLGNNIRQITGECYNCIAVRLSGSGDLLIGHVDNIISLAENCSLTQFWGMTRKREIAEAINNNLPNLKLLLTVDVESPKSAWKYSGRLCFGPRRAIDEVPDKNDQIVTVFPYHCNGKTVGNIPEHPKDCPAVRHKVSGCMECHRCWSW